MISKQFLFSTDILRQSPESFRVLMVAVIVCEQVGEVSSDFLSALVGDTSSEEILKLASEFVLLEVSGDKIRLKESEKTGRENTGELISEDIDKVWELSCEVSCDLALQCGANGFRPRRTSSSDRIIEVLLREWNLEVLTERISNLKNSDWLISRKKYRPREFLSVNVLDHALDFEL